MSTQRKLVLAVAVVLETVAAMFYWVVTVTYGRFNAGTPANPTAGFGWAMTGRLQLVAGFVVAGVVVAVLGFVFTDRQN